EVGVQYAERTEAHYGCPNGRTIVLTYPAEAEMPALWEGRGGEERHRRDATRPAPTKPVKKARPHEGMLHELRNIPEHDELLTQRLELLRSGQLRRRRA